ncbi:DNA mismatch repair protein [Ceratobasidium sp. AG-Ba]|nr:DNA mismatch repair protein [Ceratobasidium sp. AG-Ba]QRW01071.1 DNA mismatch repair protein [Ceratobasidium sp. AG-Ba]
MSSLIVLPDHHTQIPLSISTQQQHTTPHNTVRICSQRQSACFICPTSALAQENGGFKGRPGEWCGACSIVMWANLLASISFIQRKTSPTISKKARSAKTLTVGPKKRGKLSFVRLLDLPPEVFSEISKHLMPVDLLSLARSNTFFRTMLMSRICQPRWKAAIRNVPNMPESPSGFSEPEYISLLYTEICTMCGTKALCPVDPYLLARLCRGCHNESTQVVLISDPIYSLVPRSPMSKDCEPLFCTTYKSEYDEVQRECARRDPGTKWRKTRKAEVDQRQKYVKRLQQFLDSLEKEKATEAEEARKQRLKEHVWTNLTFIAYSQETTA